MSSSRVGRWRNWRRCGGGFRCGSRRMRRSRGRRVRWGGGSPRVPKWRGLRGRPPGGGGGGRGPASRAGSMPRRPEVGRPDERDIALRHKEVGLLEVGLVSTGTVVFPVVFGDFAAADGDEGGDLSVVAPDCVVTRGDGREH